MAKQKKLKIVVVGGGGRMGLPLSLLLASSNADCEVIAYDRNQSVVQKILNAEAPFFERGLDLLLKKTLGRNFFPTTDSHSIEGADVIIILIGTASEHLMPSESPIMDFFDSVRDLFRDGQTVILMSTVAPGTSERVRQWVQDSHIRLHLSYCPERVAEGSVFEELATLPQIISGFDEQALVTARRIFLSISSEVIELEPGEAEMAKLITNSWRYVEFAAANQFFMLTAQFGLDFFRIYKAITYRYPRAASFPKPGFTAGPCLLKDTKQLVESSLHQFPMGQSALLINEGIPEHIVKVLLGKYVLSEMTVGILGMAFKGESDDSRGSLSYKLRRLLREQSRRVLCTDEYVADATFQSFETVVQLSDILIVAAPHNRYRSLPDNKVVFDIWNLAQKDGM